MSLKQWVVCLRFQTYTTWLFLNIHNSLTEDISFSEPLSACANANLDQAKTGEQTRFVRQSNKKYIRRDNFPSEKERERKRDFQLY